MEYGLKGYLGYFENLARHNSGGQFTGFVHFFCQLLKCWTLFIGNDSSYGQNSELQLQKYYSFIIPSLSDLGDCTGIGIQQFFSGLNINR